MHNRLKSIRNGREPGKLTPCELRGIFSKIHKFTTINLNHTGRYRKYCLKYTHKRLLKHIRGIKTQNLQ